MLRESSFSLAEFSSVESRRCVVAVAVSLLPSPFELLVCGVGDWGSTSSDCVVVFLMLNLSIDKKWSLLMN